MPIKIAKQVSKELHKDGVSATSLFDNPGFCPAYHLIDKAPTMSASGVLIRNIIFPYQTAGTGLLFRDRKELWCSLPSLSHVASITNAQPDEISLGLSWSSYDCLLFNRNMLRSHCSPCSRGLTRLSAQRLRVRPLVQSHASPLSTRHHSSQDGKSDTQRTPLTGR